jgi:hypothetical protein
MRRKPWAFLGAAVVAAIAFVTWAEPIPEAAAPARIVFVCRNGVAMSVWSAAYFNRLAVARGLPERAIGRAAVPSFTDVPPSMALALALDGFRLGGFRPRVVSADDVRVAALVVAIDTALPEAAVARPSTTEVWDGFPPMRERYWESRHALKAKVEGLIDRLAREDARDVTAATRVPEGAAAP